MVAIAVAFTAGCIYIPGPPLTDTSDRKNLPCPPLLLGPAGRIPKGSTWQAVHETLGTSDEISTGGLNETWHLHTHLGWLWSILPGHLGGDWTAGISDNSILIVHFDQAWRVRTWSISRS